MCLWLFLSGYQWNVLGPKNAGLANCVVSSRPHPPYTMSSICEAWLDFCKSSIKNAQLTLQQLVYYLCANYLCFEEMLMIAADAQ